MRGKIFRKKINSILQDNRNDRFVGNKSRGKLNLKSLYKINHSDKVFKRKEERLHKEYYITFYLDVSGSMSDSVNFINENNDKITITRYQSLKQIMLSLMKALDNIEGLHIRLIFFSSGATIYKDYDEKFNEKDFNIFVERCEYPYDNNVPRMFLFEFIDKKDNTIKLRSYNNSYNNIIKNKKGLKFHSVCTDAHIGDGGTDLLSALTLFPSNYDNEINFILTDGGVARLRETRKALRNQKGVWIGIGMQDTDIFDLFSFREAVYSDSMSDIFKLILVKLNQNIVRN